MKKVLKDFEISQNAWKNDFFTIKPNVKIYAPKTVRSVEQALYFLQKQ